MSTDFADDYAVGDIGVDIFKSFFGDQAYKDVELDAKEDYDIMMNCSKYEIKTNYKDDGQLVIEEWYDKSKNKKGWIVTSKSDYIVFVSKESGLMYIYPTKALQRWYKDNYDWIKANVDLKTNNVTKGIYGDEWQSSYRRISINKLNKDIIPMLIQTNKGEQTCK